MAPQPQKPGEDGSKQPLRRQRTPEEILRREKPAWRPAAAPASDSFRSARPDTRSKDLDALRSKYFGKPSERADTRKFAADTPLEPKRDLRIVPVEETKPRSTDAPSPKKAVIMDDDRIVGEQG
jgi:hypothetical protein